MRYWIFVAVAMMTAPLGAQAINPMQLDHWVRDLGGEDEGARARARQMLVNSDAAEVYPRVIPLLRHESETVWRAASNTLRDLGGELGAPGREGERAGLSNALLARLSSDDPVPVKEEVLRLLPPIALENTNLQPVADLLADPALRERARTCLVETNTSRARTAVVSALGEAEPAFKAALIDALASMGDAGTLRHVTRFHEHADPGVRASVAHAMADLGGREHFRVLQDVHALADDSHREEVERAQLRLLERLGEAGGNWSFVMEKYRSLLAESGSTVIRGAALVGLGRFGDESAVDDAVAVAASDSEGALEGAVLESLRSLHGRAARARMAARFQDFPPLTQRSLLALFGSQRDAVYLPRLLEAVDSGEADVRVAALQALGTFGSVDAVGALSAAAGREGAEGETARSSLRAVAGEAAAAGHAQAAGQAWLALYNAASDDAGRSEALEGIKRHPVPAAADVLLAHLDGDSLGNLPVDASLELARVLEEAQRGEEAARLREAVVAGLDTPQETQQFIDYLHRSGQADAWQGRLGFVRKWQVAGPFAWSPEEGFSGNAVNAPEIDLAATYETKSGSRGWTSAEAGGVPAIVDLTGLLGAIDQAKAYAYAVVQVEEATEGHARMGSDDGIGLWVNGARVHENNVDRGTAVDTDSAPIQLVAGENRLLAEVTQGAGGWNFVLRLVGADGQPLEFTQP